MDYVYVYVYCRMIICLCIGELKKFIEKYEESKYKLFLPINILFQLNISITYKWQWNANIQYCFNNIFLPIDNKHIQLLLIQFIYLFI